MDTFRAWFGGRPHSAVFALEAAPELHAFVERLVDEETLAAAQS